VLFDRSKLTDQEVSRRRHRVVTVIILLTGPAILLMADLNWRTGFDMWKVLQLAVFSILMLMIALGSAQALVGFQLRRRGGDVCRIADSLEPGDAQEATTARTAVVMPICNEEVGRVFEGVRAIFGSMQRTGKLAESDFFILSDSTDPNCWIAEEAAWLALTRELNAQGRIFYRKRRQGINKKSGNISDFCRRWGKLYRYMLVLDADSIMTGEAILRLVQLMERNHRVGIIQGVPLLANGETILARLQQFASRLYGPVFAAGLNYWQLGEANYWGHNAIIRLAPFMRHCSLPELPGNGPFGGRIMSHDFVEAALMRRAGWEVWLATEIEGNYEECPPTVIDLAERDRRWLQGNLQHARLIGAKGFHAVNRIHFTLGILSYLASPLWLAFLVISTVIASRLQKGIAAAPMTGFSSYAHWTYSGEALWLFAYTTTLLFLPKILALLDLRSRPETVAAFGGWANLIAGVLLETIIFTLLAPVLMLFHTWFALLTFFGKKISWGTQRRGGADGSVWIETAVAHAGHTLFGIAAAIIVYRIDPHLAFWMSPILAGLILSIPLSYLTGSRELGLSLQRHRIFETPEESRPFPELAQLQTSMATRRELPSLPRGLMAHFGIMQAVLDPYINAVHVSFLRTKDDPAPPSEKRFNALRSRLLSDGPKALTPGDRKALLMDAESMHLLHFQTWATPSRYLSKWWQSAIAHYARLAPAPRTPFGRK
jgi:membrane glycosyltransferase